MVAKKVLLEFALGAMIRLCGSSHRQLTQATLSCFAIHLVADSYSHGTHSNIFVGASPARDENGTDPALNINPLKHHLPIMLRS